MAEDVPDQMDIDEPASEPFKDQTARYLALPVPNGDLAKAPDALSSPASTIHTATTPAVHDASTDTSPDNEGPQYNGPDEEIPTEEARTPTGPKAGEHEEASDRRQKTPAASENVPSPTQVDESGRMLNGVEAQLLEESAAASIGKTSQPTSAGSLIPVPPTIERTSPSPSESLSKGATADKESFAQEELKSTNITTEEGDEDVPESMDVDGVRPQPSERAAQETQGPDLDITANIPPSGPVSAKAPITEEAGQVPEVPAERAVTRTTSGAIKPRSVLELLGDSSKPTPQVPGAEGSKISFDVDTVIEHGGNPERAVVESVPPADSATPREPEDNQETQSRAVSTVASKSAADRLREKRRKSIPTVVFGKSTKKPADETSLARREAEGPSMKDDYFTPLFIEGFTRNTPWMKPIEQLLNQSHKTVSTPDQYIPVLEHQACRILRRVYQLQQGDKWSLRQPVRCPEPTRPASQWDVLIQEMKWMRTDFREERKWKRAVARNLANDCAEWVASTPEERKILQVNAVIPPIESGDTQMVGEALDGAEEPLPDLIHSDSPTNNEDESIEEQEVLQTVAPSAIFALPDDEVIFSLRPSNIADQLLEELPLYGAPLKVPKFDLTVPEFDPDSHWKRPAVPLSKYVEGKMVFKANGPPRRRSRYDYQDEDDDDGEVVFGQPAHSRVALPPVNANVALFNPEMQIVKDRLHAGHQFRPPVEYPMPLQSFYESRTGSQWTLAEDEELRALVREYSYNWSLISSIVQSKSLFQSGAERRTPWECFERWVALEGLPQDMGRTQYFRTYTNRIDTAQKIIAQQNQAAQQQVGPNGAVTPVPRKRATTTVRVERRRNQKHLALIDAMRKLAKKREGTVQRNQHQAALAANRKVPEPQRTAGPSKTPRDYSLMRWERDQQLAEKMAQYAARQADIQQQRRVCHTIQCLVSSEDIS
jgi:chromatin modification-related protein VID21